MKRLLSLLGITLAIAGVLGLFLFGSAIVGAPAGVMTYQVTDPLPASLGKVKWAAVSGITFSVGLVILCLATSMRNKKKSTPLTGKILHVIAGLLIVVGTVPWLWSTLSIFGSFRAMATQAETPSAESIQALSKSAAGILPAGCFILLFAMVVLLVANQLGSQIKSGETSHKKSTLCNLAALASLLLGVVVTFLFVGIVLHGTSLTVTLAAGMTPKPAELAADLNGMLIKSLLAFLAVACQGVLQSVAGIFAPTTSPA